MNDHGHEPGHDDDGHAHDQDGEAHEHGTGVLAAIGDLVRPHSHDSATKIDSALESDARGVRALKLSLVAMLATAVLQLIVVFATGSVALLSDTLHNFADALTALPIWLAFIVGRRPATRRFSYGYGRAEDLAGLVVLVFIAGSSVIAAYEAIDRLLHPAEVRYLWAVAIAGVIGFIGNELVAQYRIRVGRAIGSGALVADGLHARADGFTSLAVVVGATGVALGFPAADPIAGLIIAALILVVLKDAARDVLMRIMDGVDPAIRDESEAALIKVCPGSRGSGRSASVGSAIGSTPRPRSRSTRAGRSPRPIRSRSEPGTRSSMRSRTSPQRSSTPIRAAMAVATRTPRSPITAPWATSTE